MDYVKGDYQGHLTLKYNLARHQGHEQDTKEQDIRRAFNQDSAPTQNQKLSPTNVRL